MNLRFEGQLVIESEDDLNNPDQLQFGKGQIIKMNTDVMEVENKKNTLGLPKSKGLM